MLENKPDMGPADAPHNSELNSNENKQRMPKGRPVKNKENHLDVPRRVDNWITGTSIKNLNIRELPKLWDPFFIQRGIIGITGPTESGKSTFLRQLAMAVIAKDKNFLGYPLNVRTGRVYYVATEDTVDTVSQYLNKRFMDQGHVEPLDNIVYLFNTEDLLANLRGKLKYRNADVVICDAWADTFDGNTNNLADVRKNLEGYRALADEFGCLFIIIHHSVKNTEKSAPDKNKLNGSQSIEAKLRCVADIRIKDNSEQRIFSVIKSNYLSEKTKKESIILDFNTESLSFENNSNLKIDRSQIGLAVRAGKKYDESFWVPKMNKLREEKKLSFEDAKKVLEEEFKNENIPGLTWFKHYCKSDGATSEDKKQGTDNDNTTNEANHGEQ